MTDTPAPNDMPDEIYAKRYGQSSGGTYWDKPREGETRTRYIRADLTAPEAVGGEALNWKRQKDTVFAWAAEHGFTPVESEIVDLLSALQQPAAPAMDLEELKREVYRNHLHQSGWTLAAISAEEKEKAEHTDYGYQFGGKEAVDEAIDHLAAQGMIKGRG